jgi:hypothetical protein
MWLYLHKSVANVITTPPESRSCIHRLWPVLANERTQIRSDPVPGLSVDTLGAFRVEIAVTGSESGWDRSGWDIGTTQLGQGFCQVGRVGFCFSQTRYDIGRVTTLIGIPDQVTWREICDLSLNIAISCHTLNLL